MTLHRGPALAVLPTLRTTFDMVFIDADKQNNSAYFDWSVRLSRPGALIIVDNVVRNGAILAPGDYEKALGTAPLFKALDGEDRVEATGLQQAGARGGTALWWRR